MSDDLRTMCRDLAAICDSKSDDMICAQHHGCVPPTEKTRFGKWKIDAFVTTELVLDNLTLAKWIAHHGEVQGLKIQHLIYAVIVRTAETDVYGMHTVWWKTVVEQPGVPA